MTVRPDGAAIAAVETTTITVRSENDLSVADHVGDTTVVCVGSDIDLVVSNIRVEPANPAPGERVIIYVTVRNRGSVDVPDGNNFYVDLYIDEEPVYRLPGAYAWAAQAAWLKAGQSRTFSVPWEFSEGSYSLWAQADTDDTVPANQLLCEASETNNVGGPLTLVVGSTQRPEVTPPERLIAPNSTPRTTPAPPPVANQKAAP